MRLSIKTCTLDMPFAAMLDFCVEQGVQAVEIAHVSYKTPEERLEAARQATHLWNIGKVIHTGMCD